MIDLIISTALTVALNMPASVERVQYTARTPEGAILGYNPRLGWVGMDMCQYPYSCWVEPGQPAPLLQNEIGLQPLAELNVTIYANGQPVTRFWAFFGALWCVTVNGQDTCRFPGE